MQKSGINKTSPVAKWGTNGPGGSYRLGITSTNVQFEVYLNGNVITVAGTRALSAATWHHVAGVYTGTNLNLYVDGVLDRSVSGAGTVDLITAPLVMGDVKGVLDEVRLFNFALDSQIMWYVYHVDRDVDQMPDVWEINHGLNPFTGSDNWQDSDNDGWMNLEEYWYGTHPNNSDTDGDGIADASDSHPTDYYNGVQPGLLIISGDGQNGEAGTLLSAPLLVQVRDGNEQPLVNAPVTFTVTQGEGQLALATNDTNFSSVLALRTDGEGQAAVFVLLPDEAGTNLVRATAVSGSNSTNVTFTAVAVAPPAANVPPELIAHYAFDEGTGLTAFDSTTNDLDAVLFGDPLPTWTSGVFSNALQFDGVQNQVSVADAPKLSPRDGITVSAWVKPVSTNENFTVAKWGTNGLSGSYLLWVTSSNAEFHLFLDGSQTTVVGTNTLSLTNWHNVTGTYDGTNLNVYVDGALNNSVLASGAIDSVPAPLQMGGVAGSLDDVRLYNYALASTNILAIYQTDTDSDGLPDVFEINHFGDLSQTGGGDFDGDGASNLAEYQAGTDPSDYYNGVVPTLEIISGNTQWGMDAFASEPLVVKVTNGSGAPLQNAPVIFKITQGDAKLAAATNEAPLSASLIVRTGADGQCAAYLRLGTTVGAGGGSINPYGPGYDPPFGFFIGDSCIEEAMRAVQERYQLATGNTLPPWPPRTHAYTQSGTVQAIDPQDPGDYPEDGFYCADIEAEGKPRMITLIQSIAEALDDDAFLNKFVAAPVDGQPKITVHSRYPDEDERFIYLGDMPPVSDFDCDTAVSMAELTGYIGRLNSFMAATGYTNTLCDANAPLCEGGLGEEQPVGFGVFWDPSQMESCEAARGTVFSWWNPSFWGVFAFSYGNGASPEVLLRLLGVQDGGDEAWDAGIYVLRNQFYSDLRGLSGYGGSAQSYLRVEPQADGLADAASCPVTVDSLWHPFESAGLGAEWISSFLPSDSGNNTYTPAQPDCPSIDPVLGWVIQDVGWQVADHTIVVTPTWQHTISGFCQDCGNDALFRIEGEDKVCVGTTTTLQAVNGASPYQWDSSAASEATVDASGNPVTVTGIEPSMSIGDVTIIVIDALGCEATWPITVVGVASLLPDRGTEIDDGDGDPDTKTFVVAVTNSGVVTVTAQSQPSLTEPELPSCWSLQDGTGSSELTRTVSMTSIGSTTITATAGSSSKSTTIIVVGVDKIIESGSNPENEGPVCVLVGNSVSLTAKPTPSSAVFPPGTPAWSITSQPTGSATVTSPTTGTTTSITPDLPGGYIVKAQCGTSSKTFVVIAYRIEFERDNTTHATMEGGIQGTPGLLEDPFGFPINFVGSYGDVQESATIFASSIHLFFRMTADTITFANDYNVPYGTAYQTILQPSGEIRYFVFLNLGAATEVVNVTANWYAAGFVSPVSPLIKNGAGSAHVDIEGTAIDGYFDSLVCSNGLSLCNKVRPNPFPLPGFVPVSFSGTVTGRQRVAIITCGVDYQNAGTVSDVSCELGVSFDVNTMH